MEWELMSFKSVVDALNAGDNFLVCSDHKTSPTYGDLAKYLSPGLVEALKCYASLPRRPGVDKFLVPAVASATQVCIPSSMRTFVKRYLPCGPGRRERPTINLVRKWFHKALIGLTDTKEKLKDLMVVIDGHSKRVIDRHYYLRDVEEQAPHVRIKCRPFERTMIS